MSRTTIGYTASIHYNDTEMYLHEDPTVKRCPRCHYRLDFFLTNPDYAFKKRFKPLYMKDAVTTKTSVSATYDSQMIASIHFKEFCEIEGYSGLTFIELPKDPWHFHFIANNIIKIDTKQAGIKFDDLCPVCGNYECVTGSSTFFELTEPLKDGFYRSDLLLGCEDRKGPLLIMGIETRQKLKEAQLKGLGYNAAYGKD